jgi:hypothetical protein
MKLLRYSSLTSLLALLLFVAPAVASAATLYVDVEVNGGDLFPSDFHVLVDGNGVSPHSFDGTSSDRGKKVTLDEGYYNVFIGNLQGYVPSYSGCSGYIRGDQTRYCVVTLDSTYYHNFSYNNCYNYGAYNCNYNYNYNYRPCSGTSCYNYNYGYNNCYYNNCYNTYPTYTYPQPTVQYGYVPYLPNTGFEPLNSAALAFGLVALLISGFLLFPYVRKVFAAVLS